MSYIDTHCHLFVEEFQTDYEFVINRAIETGIVEMVIPNIDSESIISLIQLCKKYPNNLFPTIGIHPCSIKENYINELKHHEQILKENKFIAIGEIGIDLYWDKTYIKEQIIALEMQINWAIEFNLPVILHCRESFSQVFNIVKKYKNLRGVFHAFSGNSVDAKMVADIGFYIGIGGVLTFKNANLGKEIIDIPLENIVLETDSPYLTPVPFRGKRNEPAYISIIAQKLSELFNIPLQEIESTTTQNAKQLFGI
jgi:TatD DNase family protein